MPWSRPHETHGKHREQERKRADISDSDPFTLVYWDDGRMTLEDATTGRRVALEAFGPTNAQAFAQLFSAKGGVR